MSRHSQASMALQMGKSVLLAKVRQASIALAMGNILEARKFAKMAMEQAKLRQPDQLEITQTVLQMFGLIPAK